MHGWINNHLTRLFFFCQTKNTKTMMIDSLHDDPRLCACSNRATVTVSRNHYFASDETASNAETTFETTNADSYIGRSNEEPPAVLSTDPNNMFQTRNADHIFQDVPSSRAESKKHGGHRRHMLRLDQETPSEEVATGN